MLRYKLTHGRRCRGAISTLIYSIDFDIDFKPLPQQLERASCLAEDLTQLMNKEFFQMENFTLRKCRMKIMHSLDGFVWKEGLQKLK